MISVISLIRWLSDILQLVVLADIIVSFFLSPYHQVRRILDSIVNPLLVPIRRVVPTLGGLDFSPMVLIIVIWLVENLLVMFLQSFL